MNMYKFGQIEIESREFNSVYQIVKKVDLGKIRVSEGVVANKHDTRYTVGYEVELCKIVPLYIKTPKDCLSSSVSQYNESSPLKMDFDFSDDEVWMSEYRSIWWTVGEVLRGVSECRTLTGEPLNNNKYVNAKLITWDGNVRTGFRGTLRNPADIRSCYATGVLKIGSVYQQGEKYHVQVFLKEAKYRERHDF